MFTQNAFARLIDGLRAGQARARTTRLISDLPPEIQKDIGWPELYRSHRPGRYRLDW